jgi:hypothetical protein
MIDEKEAYHYRNYIGSLKGATIKILPAVSYMNVYSPAAQKAYAFMQESSDPIEMDDFFQAKISQARDKIDLIIGEIDEREGLKSDNLKRLYDDLLLVDNMKAEVPYPLNYQRGKVWIDLNGQELRIREQIRRELKDSARDLSFTEKDLRHSLLEFKLQNHKQHMMQDGDGLDRLIGLDSSNEYTGDLYDQEKVA